MKVCECACNWFRHENWSSFWPALPAPHSPDLNRCRLANRTGEGAAEGEGARGARGRVASEGEGAVFDLHMCQLCFASFALPPCGTFYFRLTDGFLFGHQQNKQMLHATQCTRRRRSLHHFAPAATVDKSPRTHCASQSSSCPNSNSSLCLPVLGI